MDTSLFYIEKGEVEIYIVNGNNQTIFQRLKVKIFKILLKI